MGAEALPEGGVHFRVWAPGCKKVSLLLEQGSQHEANKPLSLDLAAEEQGYFSVFCPEAAAGSLYRYRLDERDAYPDPASRYQPSGPHGPSCVIDPDFPWTDGDWPGLRPDGQILYEMHIGSFTVAGTWKSAAEELPELARLGVTALEIMPVADFPGMFGWGYDGVNLFAPTRLYGEPDDFRRFVDHAHSVGLGVILDVVYSHLGPEGNYLRKFSNDYFSSIHETEWGEAINYDGKNAEAVREFIISNAQYWIDEFHLDGLRLDATQSIFDSSSPHILSCIAAKAREKAGKKSLLLVAENEPQQVRCIKPAAEGGYGLDLAWNDDFHHMATVALTGYREAYYRDYLGTPQEFISAAKWGYLFQGQRYFWQGKRRGTPTFGINPSCFVNYLQNHDQVANSTNGFRIQHIADPGYYRAVTAVMMLIPGTPLLFQGQEFGSSSPFLYFADLSDKTAELTRSGRVQFLKQFNNINSQEVLQALADPSDRSTFENSRLDLSERGKNSHIYDLHRDLIRLRREDPVFREMCACRLEGAVLGPEAFLLRYFHADGQRVLLVNLGCALHLHPAPEPLLAPPKNFEWEILWSSESLQYQGAGTSKSETEEYWQIPGHAAVVLIPIKTRSIP